jgi:hypothetical protein
LNARGGLRNPATTPIDSNRQETTMFSELDRPSALIRSLFGAAALAVTLGIGIGLDALADNYNRQNLAAAHPAASAVVVAQAPAHP